MYWDFVDWAYRLWYAALGQHDILELLWPGLPLLVFSTERAAYPGPLWSGLAASSMQYWDSSICWSLWQERLPLLQKLCSEEVSTAIEFGIPISVGSAFEPRRDAGPLILWMGGEGAHVMHGRSRKTVDHRYIAGMEQVGFSPTKRTFMGGV